MEEMAKTTETRKQRGEALFEAGAVEAKALGRERVSGVGDDYSTYLKWGEFEVAGSNGERYAVDYEKRYYADDEVSCECRDSEKLRRSGAWNTTNRFERQSPNRYCKHVFAVLRFVEAENKRLLEEWRERGG